MGKKLEIHLYGVYLAVAVISSAPFMIKHLPKYSLVAIIAYTALLFGFIILLRRFDVQQCGVFNNHFSWIVGVVLLAGLNVFLYPQTRLIQHPSSSPNALIDPLIALFRDGSNPYSIRLFDGSFISPGPGWMLLNAPFLLTGLIAVLTPTYLLIAGSMIAKRQRAFTFMFIVLLGLCLCFLQLSIACSDLPAISLAFVALTVALHRHYTNKFLFFIIATVTGLVATARIPFIIMPIALSICLNTFDRHRAMQFAVISTGLATSIHAVFFVWANQQGMFYQPLHVLIRAFQGGSTVLVCIGALAWTASVLFMKRRLTVRPSSWLIFLWSIVFVPFFFVGVGELLRDGLFSPRVWAAWEGKNYVMFTIPLLIAGLMLDAASVSIGTDRMKSKI